MSLAELCKSTAKKAKYKNENKTLEICVESRDLEIKPKRVGPHTPPLPRDSPSPHHTPEPTSTADLSKSIYSDEVSKRESRYMHRHRTTCSSTSTSSSPEHYRSRDFGRSYSTASSRHVNPTSTTGYTTNLYKDPTPEPKERINKRIVLEKSAAHSREKSSEKLHYYDKEYLRRNKRVASPDKLHYYATTGHKREDPRFIRKHTTEQWTDTGASTSKCTVPASDKIPYYVDEKREQDRLRRIYGEEYSSYKRHTPDKVPPYSYRKYEENYAKRRRSYSRSKSPIPSHRMQFRHREEHCRIPYRNDRRYHHFSTHRRHEESRSRSRSRSHERKDILPPPPTQIITIPVPVADYPYAFHAWGAPFPLGPMMPSATMPPVRPPYGLPPFGSGMYRPQPRYPTMRNFAPRPMRGNLLNRNP